MSVSASVSCSSASRPRQGSVPTPRRLGYRPPDISVVIATCDRPHTIAAAVRSALDQEGVAVEVIVVDDSPTHSAASVVAALDDDRVRYLTNWRPSLGRPAIPRNTGAALAEGSLIHFLDDDDLVAPGHYAAACAAFAAQPGIGAVFGTIEAFGDDAAENERQAGYFATAQRRSRRCARLGHRWAFTAAMLFGPTLLVCSAGMVRRAQFDAVGGFDTAMPLVEDVDFYMRAIRHGGVCYLDRPALRYRIGPSLMRQPDRDRMILESYRQSQARYCARYGLLEFMTLKILAKGLRLT